MTAAPTLLITRDESLLEDLLRLAAAAGAELDVAHDTTAALRAWSSASAVLIGSDQVGALARQRPRRRDQVHVVVRGGVPDGLFRSALAAGACDVVELPAAEAWLVELLTDVSDGPTRRARTVGVVAGSGGAGATTFSCALAMTASRDAAAVLLDLDPLGPGVDRVVGLDEVEGVRWDALQAASGRLGSRALRAALPHRDGLAVLGWGSGPTGPLEAASVREVLSAAQRGHDVVVVDLPRRVDEVAAEVAARCDLLVVVAVATVPGAAAAARLTAALQSLNRSLGLVVRRCPAAVPSEHIAAALELPLLAEMPRQRRLVEDVDLGLGPVRSARSPLSRAAGAVLEAVRAAEAAA